jgi:hypothetical protein
MKKIIFLGLIALIGIRCKQDSVSLMDVKGCASEQPTLIGKWTMTEFRYYGGCCPVIADSSWKKATENSYLVEFSSDGKLKVTDNTGTNNGLIASAAVQLVANYQFDGKILTFDEQILSGVPWYKQAGVEKLTKTELILTVLVGKEGEMNARKFVRSCQ